MAPQNLFERVLKIQPGLSLGQWVYDRLAANWPVLVAAFSGLGGMSGLASATEWIEAYGPAAIGGVGIASFLIIWMGLSLIQWLRAAAAERRAYASAAAEWKKAVDKINPLNSEFSKQRINIQELAHPVTRSIVQKRIIDCELYGPANIVALGGSMTNVGMVDCDVIVMADPCRINNVIKMQEIEMFGGKIFSATIFIHKQDVPIYKEMGANFVTLY